MYSLMCALLLSQTIGTVNNVEGSEKIKEKYPHLQKDIGDWPAELPLFATFEFGNHLGVPIELKLKNKSCGCIITELSDSTLDPGQDAAITMNVPPQRLKEPMDSQSTVVLETGNEDMPFMSFALHARLVPEIELADYLRYWGSLDPEVPVTRTVKLILHHRRGSQKELKLYRTTTSCDYLAIKETSRIAKSDRTEITFEIQLNPRHDRHSTDAEVKFYTTSISQPLVTLAVKWKLKYEISHDPAILVFDDKAENAVKRVRFLIPERRKLRAISVPSGIQIDCNQIGKPVSFQVTVDYSKLPKNGNKFTILFQDEAGKIVANIPILIT